MHWTIQLLRCHCDRNLSWITIVAQSTYDQNQFGHLLKKRKKAVWTFSPEVRFEKKSDSNQIHMQSERILKMVLMKI